MTGGRSTKFLVVDDEANARRAIGRWIKLEFPRAVVVDASDAHTALRMIAAERWDIVLLDISMPEMSGLDALRQMRASNELVPVVIVSGLPAAQYEAAAAAAGAFAYVEKVRLPRDLRRIVGMVVSELHDDAERP
jgi:two-component system, NarL family, invasion response regulator UvrY